MGKLKVASLFCGCGGMDLGMEGNFEYLGKKYSKHPIEIVYALDNDKYPCAIYNENFHMKCIEGDIRLIQPKDIPPHHILTGGFPCQSFSIVAQNPPRLGYKDEKGKLFFDMCKVLKERKPIAFIAENVKGIRSANNGQAFPLILSEFKKNGYILKHTVLNASDFGIPQNRQRVFIIGFKQKEILDNFSFPKPLNKPKVPLSAVIFPEEKITERYYFSQKAVEGMLRRKKKMNTGRAQELGEPCNTIGAHLAKVSLNGTDPVLFINGKYRMFTPREAARIQSFPDTFKLVGSDFRKWKAIGNAVPPVLMWHVTKELIKAIKKTDKLILNSKPYRTNQEIRSYNMSKIHSKNTKIEITLRKALWSKGLRYRIHYKGLYGKPDIVFISKKVAIFIDSEFLHGRHYEETISRIKTNQDYWKNKILRNIDRDKEVTEKLTADGWIVLRFWDTEIKKDLDLVIEKIEKMLKKNE